MQHPLALNWRDGGHFEDYFAGDTNAATLALLREALHDGDSALCLSGPAGSGRSHLLLAAVDAATAPAQYLSLGRAHGESIALLEQQPAIELLCLDDAHTLLGDRQAESALFGLFNRMRDARCCLLFADASDRSLEDFTLPDLASRWRGATRMNLHPLSDEELAEGWSMRARLRGMRPDPAVAQWLLTHWPRNFKDWMAALDRFDQAALASGRRLTLPFARELLSSK